MKLDRETIIGLLTAAQAAFIRYAAVWFILFLGAVYGYVLFGIYASQNAQPTDADVSNQSQTTATPHIDKTVVSQIEGLQDRSVNVQTLFEQARQNPFKE